MKTVKILLGVVALSIIGYFIYWFENKSTAQPETVQENNETATVPENTQTNGMVYKDGEYKLVQEYTAPSGIEKVAFTINVSENKISSVDAESMAVHPTSKNFQGKFISGIQSAAVGQSLDTLKVNAVSGASLTSGAFNKALENVRAQAMTQ